MSLASASSSRCNRAEISTGCTSPLKARAKIPFTAPSTFFSKRVRMPIPLLPQATLDGIRRPYRPADLQVRAADCECPLQLFPADRAAVRASLSGWIAQHARPSARVAERQTRWLQVPVSARTWGFKSPLAHSVSACQTPIHRPGREDDGRDFRRLDGQAGRLGRQPLYWIEHLLDT